MRSPAVSSREEALSPEEVRQVDRVARRLHEQLRAFLGSLPSEFRNASGLARYLGVDRTTCQRAVFTATRPYPGPDMISKLPGAKGLRSLTEAGQRCEPPADTTVLAALGAAIDQYEAVLHRTAGSQTKLVHRLNATSVPSIGSPSSSHSGDSLLRSREKLFEASAEVTGRYSQTWTAVYAYREAERAAADGSPLVRLARVHGLIGHIARADAVPLTFHNFGTKSDSAEPEVGRFVGLEDEEENGGAPASVIRAFSTDPPPVVNSRQPNEYLVQSIDDESGSASDPIDLILGTQGLMAHPKLTAPYAEEAWALINFPARHLLFDVYLHRDLARACIPSLDVHLWRPDFAQHVGDRWQTRFSDSPKLELLGAGLKNAASAADPRHAELSSYLFDRCGWDPREFVGFRCEVLFPMWRTGYCMAFDFAGGG